MIQARTGLQVVPKLVTAALAIICITSMPARAEFVLRVAMTAGDIPDWTGQPDQGFEGYRFVGWSLYDALVNWDLSRSDREAPLTPGLATKWTIDPANDKRWIIELRKGVRFHDGCDLTADLVVWNIQRLVDDKTPGFHPVHFARHRSRSINVERAEKIDDGTVAIFTKTPDSLVPYNLSVWYMISKCAVEKANFDYAQYAKAPAGTGPYKFDRVVPRERLELVKNADYWDQKRVPKHDRLVLIPMPEATTRAAALLSGQVDFVEAPSPDTIPRLKSSGMNVITLPYPHNWHYQLNFVERPFNDVRVRRAANYAMDRDEMVAMLGGVAQPGYAIYTPTSKLYGKPVKYEYDTEKGHSAAEGSRLLSVQGDVRDLHLRLRPDAASADERAREGAARGGGLQGQARGDGLEHLARCRHQGPREIPAIQRHQHQPRHAGSVQRPAALRHQATMVARAAAIGAGTSTRRSRSLVAEAMRSFDDEMRDIAA